jgi:hypothetical protein
MSLNADVIADLAEKFYQEEVESGDPVVKSRSVVSEVQDSGEVTYEVVEEWGPPEVETEKIRPLMKALARAMVKAIRSNAEVVDTAAGGRWRIE